MYSWLLVIHVLGWVFWLGTDVGVLLAAKYSERSDLSAETRLKILEVGMLLDMAPRIAVPVVFMTGFGLMTHLGFETYVPLWVAMTFGAIWLAAVLTGIGTQGGQGALGAIAMRTQFAFNTLVAIGMGGVGVAALIGILDQPSWIALKWLSYGVIALAAIVLEMTFKPAIMLYGKLGEEGGSAELDSALSKSLKPVYISVLVIYAATLVAGICGLVKF